MDRTEPELAVFHHDTGEGNQKEDECEKKLAGLRPSEAGEA